MPCLKFHVHDIEQYTVTFLFHSVLSEQNIMFCAIHRSTTINSLSVLPTYKLARSLVD